MWFEYMHYKRWCAGDKLWKKINWRFFWKIYAANSTLFLKVMMLFVKRFATHAQNQMKNMISQQSRLWR